MHKKMHCTSWVVALGLLSFVVFGCTTTKKSNPNTNPSATEVVNREATPQVTPQQKTAEIEVSETHVPLSDYYREKAPSGMLLLMANDGSGLFIVDPFGKKVKLVHNNREYLGTSLSHNAQHAVYWFDGFMFVLDMESGETSQINQERIGSFQDGNMFWSSDNRKIVFDCVPPDRSNAEVCLMDIATGTHQVITDVRQHGAHPFDMVNIGSWSSDDVQIAYSLQLFPASGGLSTNVLQIVDLGTRKIQTLLDSKKQSKYSDILAPKLSPDGQSLLFRADIQDIPEIFLMDLRSKNISQVTTSENDFGFSEAVWNPDGSSFFASVVKKSEDGNLVSIPTLFSLDGEALYQMFETRGHVIQWIPNNK